METIHIINLLENGELHDGKELEEVQIVITEDVTYVSYGVIGTTVIDIWNCSEGNILVSDRYEPDMRYTIEDPMFHVIQPLIDKVS